MLFASHSCFETRHPHYHNDQVAEIQGVQTSDNATAEVCTAAILKMLKEPIAHAKEKNCLLHADLEELDDLCLMLEDASECVYFEWCCVPEVEGDCPNHSGLLACVAGHVIEVGNELLL